jgi:hypothetical protein
VAASWSWRSAPARRSRQSRSWGARRSTRSSASRARSRGAIPLPSRWRIEFCDPIDLADYGADRVDDRSLVLEITESVRDTVQRKVYENLVKRGSTFV